MYDDFLFKSCQFSDTSFPVFHKRSQAFGVLAAGASIGGTVLPIATQHLFIKVGFKLAIRIMASILAFVVLIANLVCLLRSLALLPPTVYCA